MTNSSLAGKVSGELSEVGPSLTRRGFVSVDALKPSEASTSWKMKAVTLWWHSSVHRSLCKNISSSPLPFVTTVPREDVAAPGHCQGIWNCSLGVGKGWRWGVCWAVQRAFLHPPMQVHCEYRLLANLCLLANGQCLQIQSLSHFPWMFLVVSCLLPDFFL